MQGSRAPLHARGAFAHNTILWYHLAHMSGGKQSPIFVKTYDLLLWLLGRTARFPKNERFRLAKRLEESAFAFYDLQRGKLDGCPDLSGVFPAEARPPTSLDAPLQRGKLDGGPDLSRGLPAEAGPPTSLDAPCA